MTSSQNPNYAKGLREDLPEFGQPQAGGKGSVRPKPYWGLPGTDGFSLEKPEQKAPSEKPAPPVKF